MSFCFKINNQKEGSLIENYILLLNVLYYV